MSFSTDPFADMINNTNDQIRQMNDDIIQKGITDGDNAGTANVVSIRWALDSYVRLLQGPEYKYIPLLDDENIRFAVMANGRNVWSRTKDWKAVEAAGRNYPIPKPPNLFKNYVSVAVFNERAELCNERTDLCNQQSREIQALNAKFEQMKTCVPHSTYKKSVDLCNEQNKRINQIDKEANVLMELVKSLEKDKAKLQENIDTYKLILRGNDYTIESLTKSSVGNMAKAAAFKQQLALIDPENQLIQKKSPVAAAIANVAYERFVASGNDWSVPRQVGETYLLKQNEAL